MKLNPFHYGLMAIALFGAGRYINNIYFQEPYTVSLWTIGLVNWSFVLLMLGLTMLTAKSYYGSHSNQEENNG